MKIIASCLLALGAINQEVAAFGITKSARTPLVQLNTASVDDVDTTNGSLDTVDTDFELLGLPARPGRPLKIAIAGGGVGGLTAAYYMLKKVRRLLPSVKHWSWWPSGFVGCVSP